MIELYERDASSTSQKPTKIIYHQVKPGIDCPDGIAWKRYLDETKIIFLVATANNKAPSKLPQTEEAWWA